MLDKGGKRSICLEMKGDILDNRFKAVLLELAVNEFLNHICTSI
jgi:hypothetical protein